MKTDTQIINSGRLIWVDAIKAFAIFCIVVGHALNGYSFIWKFVYGFHVPLFIMISGFTYVPPKNNLLKIVFANFKRIIIPYFIFSVISIVIYMLVGAKMDGDKAITLTQCIKGLLWANGETGIMRWNLPLWYLPMFFVLRILASFVLSEKDTTKKLFLKFSVSSILAIIVYYSALITNAPFCFETVIYLFPFFVFGMILKKMMQCFTQVKKRLVYLMCIAFFAVSVIIIAYQKNIDYVRDQYRMYMLFLVSALAMSISVTVLFSRFNFAKIFTMIGRRTMPILLMHKFPLMFFEYICPITKDLYIQYRGITSFIISIVTIFLCIIVSIFIEKFAPWIIGKENKNIC